MDLSHLLQQINQRHNTTFMLAQRYQAGEQGAFAVVDAQGRRAVLKWSAGTKHFAAYERASQVTTHLHSLGYPVPRYLATGVIAETSYSLQEALAGTPMGSVTPQFLPRVLELNRMQQGQANIAMQHWPELLFETVLYGGDEYCVLDSLRTYSSATAALLEKLQAQVVAHLDDDYITGDIVHFDFHALNILVADGQVSGVIDWDGVRMGDATFDLVTLLMYACMQDWQEVVEQLWHHALERSGPATVSVYLAHMLVRQLDWMIRYYAGRDVEKWLAVAGRMLPRCCV